MADQSKPVEKGNSRREFFRGLLKKAGDTALQVAEAGLAPERTPESKNWVRPPGALPESEFLQACTRCGECLPACPHGTVFLLGDHSGAAANTPALDLVGGACHVCEDFPCVAACEPGALRAVTAFSLRFAQVRINPATCLPFLGPECGVCVAACPTPGAITLNLTIPEIDPNLCTGCAMCREVCVVNPSAITVHPLAADS